MQSFQELTHQAMPRASGLQTQSLMSILQNCACWLMQLKSDLNISILILLMNAAEKGICKECIELHLAEELLRKVCQLPESLHLLHNTC